MRNISKNIVLVILMLSCYVAEAQEKKSVVTQNVNVVKNYVPIVGKATKMNFNPLDEAPINIDLSALNYNILYRSEPYMPSINSLSIPHYERSSFYDLYSGYADLMLGLPLQSRANVFYTTKTKRDVIMGASFSNDGYYGKIKNDYGEKTSGLNVSNSISAMLKYRVNRLEIDLDAMFKYHNLNRYGYSKPFGQEFSKVQYEDLQSSLNKWYLRGYANISIGVPQSEETLFSGKFRGFFSFIEDSEKYKERITHASIDISSRLLKEHHRIFLDYEYMILIAGKTMVKMSPINNPSHGLNESSTLPEAEIGDRIKNYSTMFINPMYQFTYDVLDIKLGAKMVFGVGNKWYGQKKGNINPVLKVQAQLLKGAIVPYFDLDGQYEYNNYYNLSQKNPFVENGLTAPNTNTNSLSIGFKGSVLSKLLYNIHVGGEMKKDMVTFVNNKYGNTFVTAVSDYNNFICGAEFEYSIIPQFSLGGAYLYTKYEDKKAQERENQVFGLPAHKVNFRAQYKYRKKFVALLNVDFQSKRDGATLYDDQTVLSFNEMPSCADVSLHGFYHFNNRIGFKGELNNIFNQKLYKYNYYQGIGFNILLGVSYKF
ncbi:MAG: hypothetical protein IMY73_01520 [Bacteroidetes bacterium]|nr:hypothetical protein [Bacteroidota bacterium]